MAEGVAEAVSRHLRKRKRQSLVAGIPSNHSENSDPPALSDCERRPDGSEGSRKELMVPAPLLRTAGFAVGCKHVPRGDGELIRTAHGTKRGAKRLARKAERKAGKEHRSASPASLTESKDTHTALASDPYHGRAGLLNAPTRAAEAVAPRAPTRVAPAPAPAAALAAASSSAAPAAASSSAAPAASSSAAPAAALSSTRGSPAAPLSHPAAQIRGPRPKFVYGNYDAYYGYRYAGGEEGSGGPEPRVRALRRELFCGKRCLDIGCNAGQVTPAGLEP